jgi:hypothetical protein
VFSADHNAGFLEGFADCGEGERARGLTAGDHMREPRLDARMQLRGRRRDAVSCLDPPAWKHEAARHEGVARMPLSEKNLRLASGAIDQNERCGISRPDIRMRQSTREAGDRSQIMHSFGPFVLIVVASYLKRSGIEWAGAHDHLPHQKLSTVIAAVRRAHAAKIPVYETTFYNYYKMHISPHDKRGRRI